MMGLYIRGVGELPPGEYRMTLDVFKDGSAGVDFYSFAGGEDRFDVILVPPHGDLIDRDALIKNGWLNLYKEVMRMGGYAIHELPLKNPSIPVIIPASEEGV